MARGFNQVTLIGNLGKDIELKYTGTGVPVASASIAINESWKDKEGTLHEEVEWVNLVFWRGLAEIAGQYLHKGSKVFVTGKLKTRSWDKDDGTKAYKTEVVVDRMNMLDGAPEGGAAAGKSTARPDPTPGPEKDDLPF